MEKGTIPGGPVLDEVETRIHPELTTEDESEPGAPQSSGRRHRDDERRAAHRNNWPLGRVVHASRSEDGRVRKATVLICRDGQRKTYERPISTLVLLVPSDNNPVG